MRFVTHSVQLRLKGQIIREGTAEQFAYTASFDVATCRTPFKGSSFKRVYASDCVSVGHVIVPSTIDHSPRMSRTVSIRNFHVWKFAASFSRDGISYRRLEAGIGLDWEGVDPFGFKAGGEGGNGVKSAMRIDLRA